MTRANTSGGSFWFRRRRQPRNSADRSRTAASRQPPALRPARTREAGAQSAPCAWPRAGARTGTLVGSPRCSRIFRATGPSSICAMTRRAPPQSRQRRISIRKTRFRRSAHLIQRGPQPFRGGAVSTFSLGTTSSRQGCAGASLRWYVRQGPRIGSSRHLAGHCASWTQGGRGRYRRGIAGPP